MNVVRKSKSQLNRGIPTIIVGNDSKIKHEQTEEELHQNESRLQLAQTIARLGIWDWDIASDKTTWSGEMFNIYGITPETFTGNGQDYINFTHPDDRSIQISNIQKSFERSAQKTLQPSLQGTTDNLELDPHQFRIIRPDGSICWVEGEAITIVDDEGKPVKMVGVLVDITERKQAGEALTASEAELRALFASMQDIVLVIDRNGVYRKIAPTNPNLLYKPSQEMLGKNLWDILPAEQADTFNRVIQQVLKSRQTARIEYSLPIGDHLTWFAASISLMDSDNTLWVARDITDRKHAEQMQAALYEIANVAQTTVSLNELFASIHKTLGAFMPAENFYIAMYDKQNDLLSFPYFVDQYDKAPLPQKPGFGLTEYVLRTRQPLLATPQVFEEMIGSKKVDLLGRASVDWIGVPLTVGDESFGVMVVQTYSDKLRLAKKELDLLAFVSTQTALVIKRKKAEETLLQFREVMDESNDAIYFIDTETSRYIDFNKNAMEFLGYDKEELSQLGVIDIAQHVNSIERWRERVELIGKNNGLVFQTAYRRKNDTLFPVEVSARILEYGGKPIMVAVVRDITERTQAEAARERQLQELTGLNAIASACAFATDANDEESLLNVTSIIIGKVLYPEDFGFFMVDEAGLLRPHSSYHQKNGTPNEFIRPGEGLIGQAAKEGKAFRSGDVRLEKNYIAASPTSLSELAVPLKIKERVLGVINTESNHVNAFSEADERLLSTAADQIATALGRIRLQKETVQRAREFASLYETSNALSVENDLTALLQVIVEHAATLLNASIGAMYLFNKPAQDLETVVATSSDIPIGIHLDLGEGAAGRVAQTRLPLRLDDYSNWQGRSPKYEGQIFRAILEVPMLFGGELIGVLSANEVGDSERKFTEADEHLLSLFASQAAGAIHATRLLEETRRRAEEFTTLYETTHDLAMQQDLSTVMAIITKRASALLGAPNATILLYDPVRGDLEIAATIGPDLPIGTRRKLGDGLAGRVAQSRMPLMIDDYQQWEHRSALYAGIPYTAIMGVPLLYGGNLLGVLDVSDIAPSRRTFNETDIRLLSLFAGQAASTIANAQLFEELKKSNTDITSAYDTTIEGWSRAMDLRDHETEGHTLRVTDLTLNLARGMRLNESLLTQIRRGSLLHDIGKMGVPDSILLKDGNLNEEEWVIMRKHPQFAYEMLSAIDYLHEALDIPSNHHEKWDGSGYPRGLKGEQIPLAARIFAVVDVWDAIRSDRPYRKGWNTEKAIEYIKSQSGTHFDPKIVRSFLNLLGENNV